MNRKLCMLQEKKSETKEKLTTRNAVRRITPPDMHTPPHHLQFFQFFV